MQYFMNTAQYIVLLQKIFPFEKLIMMPSQGLGVLVFNATFNNILVAVSFIGGGKQSTWRKSLTSATSRADKFYHLLLYRVHLAMRGIQTHNLSGDWH